MIRFIKLTNNFDKFKGTPIYLNVDHIVSIYDEVDDTGMSRTKVYGDDGNMTVWDVEESASQIFKMLKELEG